MITFNNLCLKYVGVAFYFVSRSLTTVFNVILVYFILNETTSWKAISCCIIIIIGFALGVDQEGFSSSFSWSGVAYGILASLSVSLYSIFTKSKLKEVDGNVWTLAFYNNINALIIFLVLIIYFNEIQIVTTYPQLSSIRFWCIMILSGFFAVAISFATTLQIKVTSPLTHNISGTAKACFQTWLAIIWYNDSKGLLWWFGNFLGMAGSAAYTRVKQLEMKKNYYEQKQEKELFISSREKRALDEV